MAISKKRLIESFPELSPGKAAEISRLIKIAEEDGGYVDVDVALDEFDKAVRNYGVEAIEGGPYVDSYYMHINLLYSNSGDTYTRTLVYDTLKGKFYLTSWGDIVEAQEKRFEER